MRLGCRHHGWSLTAVVPMRGGSSGINGGSHSPLLRSGSFYFRHPEAQNGRLRDSFYSDDISPAFFYQIVMLSLSATTFLMFEPA